MTPAAHLKELSEPWAAGERVKTAIARAAHLAGLSYWRAFDIWYGKARRVEQFERERIFKALAEKRSLAAQNELHDLKLRLLKLEAQLSATTKETLPATGAMSALAEMRS